MYVRHLSLHNFRSWQNLSIELKPGISVFVGSNGNGKTNIVEALGYLAHLRSHRVNHDSALVREGHDLARISATAVNDGRELTAHLALRSRGTNKAQINRTAMPSQQDLLGIIRTTLFSPEDLFLVRGEPEYRRLFLDTIMISRYPRLAGIKAEYDRILKQRNALLKNNAYLLRNIVHNSSFSTVSEESESIMAMLEVWDQQLAAHGGQLISARMQIVHDLKSFLQETYQQLAPESRPVHCSYTSTINEVCAEQGITLNYSVPDEDTALITPEVAENALIETIHRRRSAEIDRGVTLVGPHRDDMQLMLGTQPAKGFASHGESWSYALSLRLAAFFLLKGHGAEPVVILDDVFAELDSSRRNHLVKLLSDVEQVLITAAVAEDIPEELRRSAHIFSVFAHHVDNIKVSYLKEDTLNTDSHKSESVYNDAN